VRRASTPARLKPRHDCIIRAASRVPERVTFPRSFSSVVSPIQIDSAQVARHLEIDLEPWVGRAEVHLAVRFDDQPVGPA
jgi:hypothetical protein